MGNVGRYSMKTWWICAAFYLLTSCRVEAGGRLSDLVARFKGGEQTTKNPSGLDSLLRGYDPDREKTHSKSWTSLDLGMSDGPKDLTSLLEEYYPQVSTPGYGKHWVDVGYKEEGRRSTSAPDVEPTVPTRHHHRYHRGDALPAHQPQADSTFSLTSANGYYDYSANGGSTASVKKAKAGSSDWKKTAKSRDKNKWTSGSNHGVVIGTVSRSEVEDDSSARKAAALHIKASSSMGCKVPMAKIIRISDHYPSSRMYLPSCTRLHQCDQDTGCCPATKRCGPKTTQRVELYFYSTRVRSSGSEGVGGLLVEKLPFYNHTECECQDRSDEMPRDHDLPNSALLHNSLETLPTSRATFHRNLCQCPTEFTLKFVSGGTCACDCFDRQKECTKYKRGKEFFNHQDKLCIALGKCVVPMCDYGPYNRRYGRCPRKHERHKSSWSKYN